MSRPHLDHNTWREETLVQPHPEREASKYRPTEEDSEVDEKTARGKVQGTFSDLDTWEKIPGPFITGSGSELRGDDYDWPPFGVSQVAWAGLQVAVDCLQAVRHHLDPEKTAKSRHFLFADLSLCRTALVGASQAVWVLSPDSRSLRVERARTIVAHTQARHVDYLHALQAYAQTPDANTDTVTAHVEKRITELNAKRAADEQKAGLKTTKMIREAAQSTFGQLAEEAVLAWMEGSGAAHGLIWQILGQSSTVQTGTADASGLAPFEATGSFDRIANPYMAAYWSTSLGWKLLRQRGY